ncbi:MAG TPA: NifU family protein [Bacteroidales bacterium]|nr:NifU family protein [Bacteroidales bacterium]HQL69536.1 NifU family protein [Bacteroidales bacterium]
MEEIKKRIQQSIDEIRPYLKADGGDISLVEVTDDMIVKVKLLGACGACPFSIQTLKLGVEAKLIQDVPEVKEVVSV